MVERGRSGGLKSAAAREKREEHVRSRLRRHVEQNFDRVVSALESGLDSTDVRVRVRSATELLSQGFGSPAASPVGDRPPEPESESAAMVHADGRPVTGLLDVIELGLDLGWIKPQALRELLDAHETHG